MRFLFLMICALVAVDQTTKFIAESLIPQGGFFVMPYFFELRLYANPFLFGLSVSQLFLVIAAFLFAAFFIIAYALYREKVQGICRRRTYATATAFIVSGILSNGFDRLRLNAVIDWINIQQIGIFNLADIFIVFGVFLYLVLIVLDKEKDSN